MQFESNYLKSNDYKKKVVEIIKTIEHLKRHSIVCTELKLVECCNLVRRGLFQVARVGWGCMALPTQPQ